MSSAKRLRLDEVFTSFPELGPTVPDGGYAWIVLCGVFLVQASNLIITIYFLSFFFKLNSSRYYVLLIQGI